METSLAAPHAPPERTRYYVFEGLDFCDWCGVKTIVREIPSTRSREFRSRLCSGCLDAVRARRAASKLEEGRGA